MSKKKFYLRHLEYNIVEHCNLKCAGCDHSSFLMPKKFISGQELERDLTHMGKAAHVGILKLIGGEPTLHPNIIDLIDISRKSKISEKLAVISNGTLLHKLPVAFWKKIDLLKISLYPGIKLTLSQDEIRDLGGKHKVEIIFANQDIFRHTVLDRKTENTEEIKRVYDACELPYMHACHTLRSGCLYKCSPAAFLPDRLRANGIDFDRKYDAVNIYNDENLKDNIEKYMKNNEPLASCSFCLGTSGKPFPHRQMTSAEIKALKGRTEKTR